MIAIPDRHPSPPRRRGHTARPWTVAASCALLLTAAVAWTPGAEARDEKKPLTFVDLMKFRTIQSPVISEDGTTVAYQLQPDRGDGEVVVKRVDGSRERRVELGADPRLAADGRRAILTLVPSLEATETAEDDPPENGLALVEFDGGEIRTWERVERAVLTDDGRHLAILHTEKARDEAAEEGEDGEGEEAEETEAEEPETEEIQPPAAGEEETSEASEVEGGLPGEASGESAPETTSGEVEEEEGEAEGDDETEDDEEEPERLGTTLRLLDLERGTEVEIEHVADFAFAETGGHLAYAIAAPGGENALHIQALGRDVEPLTVTSAKGGRYTAFAWAEDEPLFAFIAAVDDEDGEPGDGGLWIWQASSGEGRAVAATDSAPDGSYIPSTNQLTWSRDGQRLFYGTKPRPEAEPAEKEKGDDEEAFDPYDVEALLDEKGVDVWHVDDPLIKTNERASWVESEKDRTFLAVYHRDPSARTVQLADLDVRQVRPAHNGRAVLGAGDTRYLRERTWDGFYADLFWISLDDGSRQQVAERLPTFSGDFAAWLSPNGRYAAWFQDGDWHLFDSDTGESRNLTAGLGVPFDDEDHDYPQEAGSHGLAGWLEDSSQVWIHDRYDVWAFDAASGAATNLTEVRDQQLALRVIDENLDDDDAVTYLPVDRRVLLHGARERQKNHGFWQLGADRELQELVESDHHYRLVARAENADRLLYTRESYTEFPDLRITGPDFASPRTLSEANPQIDEYAWGRAELVQFRDADGRDADAVLIRPDTLEDGERCPVLVYYYRFFSQRLYAFNDPRVNHRPSFPVYASHGYCIFLPDIRFEIGRPGFSATKALVPAVQKIIDMGVADPDAIGLHGHSWSGYQTAFVITQTHIFAAAVAGAPVSNMTSAYGGIRYGTGLSRQFQYEMGQSRLGRSLWEARDLYIENSPLFYADRIETPLLIQFGDADEAVPWTQGVELYLALRRLDKEAVFLQYHGEPHHLKKYPNKLDYSIKMKEFFDHHLKGAPAPAWWSEGVPYRGDDEK